MREPRCEWCGHGNRDDRGEVKSYADLREDPANSLADFGYSGYHAGCWEARLRERAARKGRERGRRAR